jgi:hypothetical protein
VRGLNFYAVAGKESHAEALMLQTETTLRPFERYLDRAIRSARDRWWRNQVGWEPVRQRWLVTVTALDRRVLVNRRDPAWRITNWPRDLEPDTSRPLQVPARDLQLAVALERSRHGDDLRIRVDGDLRVDDVVWWCGRQCEIAREPAPSAPSIVETVGGQRIHLRRAPEADDDGWILVLEGTGGDDQLCVDGEMMRVRELSPDERVRRLRDAAGRSFELNGDTLLVEQPPDAELLTADNGVRFRCHAERRGRQDGPWVQLLPPDDDEESSIDPRAAFCEGDVREVVTSRRRSRDDVYRVIGRRADSYQLLLDRLPPEGSTLYLPVNTHSLGLQLRAIRQLKESPLPHQRGLLRLCENSLRVEWPRVAERWPSRWTTLTDEELDGTDEQRKFVARALGTPDLAILEGPPGSGKTTAICELVRQLAADGQRVLLCASTNAAIDNVLERLIKARAPVDAVRIGLADRVDPEVRATQIDEKVDALLQAWRDIPHLQALGGDPRPMAERVVVASAHLTCGTTMGIVRHPVFAAERHATVPQWDVLIVDEASKTLIQEFMVPALLARRWVIVGDVQQLAPFTDQADIVANLETLANARGRGLLPDDHQRACMVLFRMARPELRETGARWLIVERPGVLDFLAQEACNRTGLPSIARVVARPSAREGLFQQVTVEQVRAGEPESLALAACDWVLVGSDVLGQVAGYLPSDLMHAKDLSSDPLLGKRTLPESHPLFFRHAWWLHRAGSLRRPPRGRRDGVVPIAKDEASEQDWLTGHKFAGEIAWRMIRVHELRRSNPRERARRQRELERILPATVDVTDALDEIQDIGLPSILEVLQEGIGVERTSRPSALTEGMKRGLDDRFVSLSFQHRMHRDISAFPRAVIYEGRSLRDANTIRKRDSGLGWDFGRYRSRSAWVDVRGGGHIVNQREVDVMEAIVRGYLAWAVDRPPPEGRRWEVACLSFYSSQERAISKMLRTVTKDHNRYTRFTVGNVEIVCGTVDRFQGREADLVLLSMRNTGRTGFLDSRNRLNVAVTRARQQLVILGDYGYYSRCRIDELEQLTRHCQREDDRSPLGGPR